MTTYTYYWESMDWFFADPETFAPVFSIGKVSERAWSAPNIAVVESADCEPP